MGKPSKGTPADKRLAANKGGSSKKPAMPKKASSKSLPPWMKSKKKDA